MSSASSEHSNPLAELARKFANITADNVSINWGGILFVFIIGLIVANLAIPGPQQITDFFSALSNPTGYGYSLEGGEDYVDRYGTELGGYDEFGDRQRHQAQYRALVEGESLTRVARAAGEKLGPRPALQPALVALPNPQLGL